MAAQTKMIIITSDEDLIRQIALNKKSNTRIVDLDHSNEVNSTTQKDNNMIDLAFLAEFATANSKRALDSSDESRSKQLKTSKKSADLVCAVCGDRAIGYNYDVPSCASCKAFFRRNAHQSREKLKCFTNQNQCSVAHQTRRKCARCRFDRCFAVGMRKDFILSEEERKRRQERIDENRRIASQRTSASTPESINEIDQLLVNLENDSSNILSEEIFTSNEIENILFNPLSIEDLQTIENVRSALLSTFPLENSRCFCIDISDRISAMTSWSQFAHKITLHFIDFFRKIEQFENLHNDDRFILIKYNLASLFGLSKCYSYRPINDCCSCENNVFAEKNRQFFTLCGDTYGIRDMFVKLVISLVDITSQDPAILALLLIILIFSQGSSMNENQPALKDPLAVNRAQTYYTKILWNYLVHKCGEAETNKYFTRLAKVINENQSSGKTFRDFLRIQYSMPDIVNNMAPLLQTILHIS